MVLDKFIPLCSLSVPAFVFPEVSPGTIKYKMPIDVNGKTCLNGQWKRAKGSINLAILACL